MSAITIHVDGPVADGRAERIIDMFREAAVDEVAQQGLAEVQMLLDRSLRNPTPYYETQIVVDRAGMDRVVHDRGVIYGPWLEGTGSRNRTTRFKGYASFRRAAQQVERQAGTLAEHVLPPYLAMLGGA